MAARFTLDNAWRGILNLNELGYVSPYFTLNSNELGTLDDDRLAGAGVGFVVGDSSWGSERVVISGMIGPTQTTDYAPVLGVVGYTGSIGGSQTSAGLATGVVGYLGTVTTVSLVTGLVIGFPQITDSVNGESTTVGNVVGNVGKSGTTISVSASDGVAIGNVTYFGATTSSNTSNGNVIGVEGNVGTTSGSNITAGTIFGNVGYVGNVIATISSAGSTVGEVTYQGRVIGQSTSAGIVAGEIEVIALSGNVNGISVSSGFAVGVVAFSGSSAGISSSSGKVSDAPQSPIVDIPSTLPWLVGGRTSFRINILNGVTQSEGAVSGAIGFPGVTVGVSPSDGIVLGFVRIREQDDLEVLELLGMI